MWKRNEDPSSVLLLVALSQLDHCQHEQAAALFSEQIAVVTYICSHLQKSSAVSWVSLLWHCVMTCHSIILSMVVSSLANAKLCLGAPYVDKQLFSNATSHIEINLRFNKLRNLNRWATIIWTSIKLILIVFFQFIHKNSKNTILP